MSGDEESFIVLDETPSMLQYSILDASLLNDESIISKNHLNCSANSSLLSNDVHLNSIDTLAKKSANPDTSAANERTGQSINEMQLKSVSSPFTSASQPVLSEMNGGRQHPTTTTLAHSFLLGAIDCDTMKNNVKSYFPSLSNSTNTEEIENLQSLIQERNQLKDTLQKTNVEMRQQFSMVHTWHHDVKRLRDKNEEELKKFKNINDELFHQNHDLQEKVAELQQLAELSRTAILQAEQNKINSDKLEIERLQKEVTDLRNELGIVIASKVELDEIHREIREKHQVELANIQKMYQISEVEVERLQKEVTDLRNELGIVIASKVDLDEIHRENRQKHQVELENIQKMHQISEVEIYKQKIQNENLKMDLKQSKDLIVKYRDEIGAVQAQCEVFRNDFELERKAREEMASERDQMITEMKLLKRRNQALIDEAQSYYTETSLTSLPSGSNNEPNGIMTTFTCPICSIVCTQLSDLESHVQACLERTI